MYISVNFLYNDSWFGSTKLGSKEMQRDNSIFYHNFGTLGGNYWNTTKYFLICCMEINKGTMHSVVTVGNSCLIVEATPTVWDLVRWEFIFLYPSCPKLVGKKNSIDMSYKNQSEDSTSSRSQMGFFLKGSGRFVWYVPAHLHRSARLGFDFWGWPWPGADDSSDAVKVTNGSSKCIKLHTNAGHDKAPGKSFILYMWSRDKC